MPLKLIDYDLATGKRIRKRKPVSQSIRTKALVRAKGKCQLCHRSLSNITPHIHHKDGNPRHNTLSNVIVLCPNCHSRRHEVRTVTITNALGFRVTRRKIVAKRLKKRGKKPKTRRKKIGENWITGKPIYRRVRVKTKKKAKRGKVKKRRRKRVNKLGFPIIRI